MGLISDVLGGGGGAPAYRPYSTTSGVGDVNVSGNTVDISLDPRYQAIVDSLIGGFADSVQPGLSAEQLALGAGATRAGAGFMSALQETDPFALAEQQFGRMEAILEPGRNRTRQASEARLLQQGRLDSTGGARTTAALEEGIEQSRRANLVEAFGQAQGVQRQQADLATGLGAFGGGIEDQQLQRLLQSLGSATAVEALPAEMANVAANLSGQRSAHELQAAQMKGGGLADLLRGGISGWLGSGGNPIGSLIGAFGGANVGKEKYQIAGHGKSDPTFISSSPTPNYGYGI